MFVTHSALAFISFTIRTAAKAFAWSPLIREMIEDVSVQIPREFHDIAVHMHQDIDRVLSFETEGIQGLIEYLVEDAGERQRQVAAQFIDGLLSSKLPNEELVTVWIQAGADCSVDEDHIVPFLEQLRAALLAPPE
jgi:hypothetical protein